VADNQALAGELQRTRDELAAMTKSFREQLDQTRAVSVRSALSEQRERRSIAEGYREQLAQLLVGIQYKAGVIAQARGLQSDPQWRELTDLVTTALRTALNIGGTLAPHVLSREELLPAIRWLIVWMQGRYGFTVQLIVPATVPTSPEPVTLLLFHAIRHLLINAATHAQVQTAQVGLAQQEGGLRITVSDDGIGFDPADLARRPDIGRVGLASIKQMMMYLGGTLEIASAPGQGSRFTLTVPLQPVPPPA
jgi:signal transduction histidine kinase